MNLKDKKILITGADGFIGSHLTEALVTRCASVRAFVYYNSFNSWGWLDETDKHIQSRIEVFAGDIRDPHGVKQAMEGCDIVFHLAALIAIPYSYHSPDTYIDTNVKGTLNVLQAAREKNIARIIHTSTSEVYGTARYVPITEDHPLQAQSPYAASKIGADHVALSFYHSFDTPVSVIRPFNTYGPRQSARAVIPAIITQIASGNPSVKLGSVTPARDFNYVSDTVRGFIAVAQSDKSVGQVINIGSNFEISIDKTVRIIAGIMNRDVAVQTDSVRVRPAHSEVDRLWADNAKAKNLLGWEPEYAGEKGFKSGLEKTVQWFSDPENLKKYKSGTYAV